jgi:hypothetical protein
MRETGTRVVGVVDRGQPTVETQQQNWQALWPETFRHEVPFSCEDPVAQRSELPEQRRRKVCIEYSESKTK